MPVSKSHIRRHVGHRWPDHADDYDFFREPQEQRRVTTTYRCPAPDDRLDLIKGYGASNSQPQPHLSGTSYGWERPPLACLLARLMTDAGLQRIGRDWRRGSIGSQYGVLRNAAGSIHLMPKAPLKYHFCSYAPDVGGFYSASLPPTKATSARRARIASCWSLRSRSPKA